MRRIKRVLWVDDHPEIEVRSLFRDDETEQVRLMENAIEEISSGRLYDYDTIVFDIDFSNGLQDPDVVINRLTERIYIDPAVLNDPNRRNKYIIENGGYLLFVYLLERGYPSNQVAFLTGNPGMMKKLQDYNRQNTVALTKEEIFSAYCKAWDDAGDGDDAWDVFVRTIESLPAPSEYRAENTIIDCSEYLENNDEDGLREYIDTIKLDNNTGYDISNTGDIMIYRFHEANLESPIFFTKRESFIPGHDIGDAEQWLNNGRTEDRLTRWLILSAGNYVKDLFDEHQYEMQVQMGNIFSNINTDPGIGSSFSQLYNLYYGLRDFEQMGPYYQAISAMLIPFDHNPQNSGRNAIAAGNNYDKVQRAFARMSKQARNYCAHNYFGSSVSNKSALYIIMGTISGVLTKSQREAIDNSWYMNAKSIIGNGRQYDRSANVQKINQLCTMLIENQNIDLGKAFHNHPPNTFEDYTPWDILRALGYNSTKDVANQPNRTIREEYFVFTLAAYIVKWFEGMTEEVIYNNYGEGIKIIVELSNEIVNDYNYIP